MASLNVLNVLNGVSMTVRAGECIALVGASGRGKSTLMKCLYGSSHVDRGHARRHRGPGRGGGILRPSPDRARSARRPVAGARTAGSAGAAVGACRGANAALETALQGEQAFTGA
jgi:energy-coupling factor transporter ATP-binding protein EcfA2